MFYSIADLDFPAKPTSKWSAPERRPSALDVHAPKPSPAKVSMDSRCLERGHRENCNGLSNGSPTVASSRKPSVAEKGSLPDSDRNKVAPDWRGDPGVRLAKAALDNTMQKLDLGNAWSIAVEEPLMSARSMEDVDAIIATIQGLVDRKRRAYTAAGVWDDDLEDVRSALEARCVNLKAAAADLLGEELPAESEASQRVRKVCKRSPSVESYDSPSVLDEPELREGCNSEAACVGGPDDPLYRLSGIYCGVFCAQCTDILREEDKNLIAVLIDSPINVGSARR